MPNEKSGATMMKPTTTTSGGMTLRADINEADANYEAGLKNINLEDYKNALENFTRALDTYKKYSKEEQAAYCLDKMGVCYLKLRNYVESYRYMTEAYEKRKQIYPGRHHPDLLISLISLASYYDSIGNYPSADMYREEAARMRQSIGASVKDAEFATSLNNLGISYMKLGDVKLALDYIEQVPTQFSFPMKLLLSFFIIEIWNSTIKYIIF